MSNLNPNHNSSHSLKSSNSETNLPVKTNSAESQMIEGVLRVSPEETIKSVQEKIFSEVENFDTISYIYVCNKSKKLIGVISIQELFVAKKSALISDVMIKEIFSARLSTHKEKVALIALKHHIKSVPVVDKNGIFKGIVPSDAILDILNNANLEDTLLSAGIHSSDPIKSITETSIPYHIKKRFPWLIIGLAGMMLTTLIVALFDEMLEKQILLAAFIPVIVYMSDAAGNQTQTIFIEAMVLDDKFNFFKFFARELKVALMLGMILSTFVFIIASLVWKLPIISFIFSFSLLAALIGASIMAIIVPALMKKMNIDPEVASGPLASVIRDAYSLSIYLFFANLLIELFG